MAGLLTGLQKEDIWMEVTQNIAKNVTSSLTSEDGPLKTLIDKALADSLKDT